MHVVSEEYYRHVQACLGNARRLWHPRERAVSVFMIERYLRKLTVAK